MKSLVIILVICTIGAYSVSLKDEQKAKLKEYTNTCITQTGLSKAELDDIIKTGQVKQSENFDCYASCMLKLIGILRADGTFDEETAHKKAAAANISVDQINNIINKCKTLSGKNECEKGGNLLKCYMANKNFSLFNG